MDWNPASLRLIAITDSLRDGVQGLTARAERAVLGGATMIQLRLPEESPRTLVDVARSIRGALPETPLLVNSRVDVALAAGANGVHLGSEDLTPASLRHVVPTGFVIGVSVGSDAEVTRAAGADYVGIGPVFATGRVDTGGTMGLQRFVTLAQMCGMPAVAIGGISRENVADVMRTCASGVAVISALFAAADPMQAARAIRAAQDASES